MKFSTILSRLLGAFVGAPVGFLFDGPAAAVAEVPPGGAPASGGTPPAGGGGAPASRAPAGSPGSAAAPGGAPASAPAGAVPAGRTYTEAEYQQAVRDAEAAARRGYVPSHRLTEETRARQTAEARIRALAGVEPRTPEQEEVLRTREGFLAMFPEFKHLLSLTPERLEQLERALESGDHANDVVAHHWNAHADRIYKSAAEQIEAALGIEKLADRQYNRMVQHFRAFAREAAGDTEESVAAFRQRYEASDPALIAEFVKEFTDDWIAPSRRQAVAGVVNRPRVPSTSRPAPITTPPPNLENIKTPDDAESVGIQYLKDRGINIPA